MCLLLSGCQGQSCEESRNVPALQDSQVRCKQAVWPRKAAGSLQVPWGRWRWATARWLRGREAREGLWGLTSEWDLNGEKLIAVWGEPPCKRRAARKALGGSQLGGIEKGQEDRSGRAAVELDRYFCLINFCWSLVAFAAKWTRYAFPSAVGFLYMCPLCFRFPSHVGHCRASGRVPRAVRRVLLSYLLAQCVYSILEIYISPRLPVHSAHVLSLGLHALVLSVSTCYLSMFLCVVNGDDELKENVGVLRTFRSLGIPWIWSRACVV